MEPDTKYSGRGAAAIRGALVGAQEPLLYREIARKAQHLRELGLSDRGIATLLGVSDRTATKTIRWVKSVGVHE